MNWVASQLTIPALPPSKEIVENHGLAYEIAGKSSGSFKLKFPF
jgi:hypothetical protein